MIGSEESTVRQAVDASLKSIPQAELTLKDLVTKKGGISFAYTARYNAPNMFLQLALIQKKAETKVVKGENKGRTLSHIQIVRDFQTIDLKGKTDGVIQLPLSSGGQPANFEVIAFLQNNQTGEIITATRLPLGIPAGRNAN
jgi:hypothetical protein